MRLTKWGLRSRPTFRKAPKSGLMHILVPAGPNLVPRQGPPLLSVHACRNLLTIRVLSLPPSTWNYKTLELTQHKASNFCLPSFKPPNHPDADSSRPLPFRLWRSSRLPAREGHFWQCIQYWKALHFKNMQHPPGANVSPSPKTV